MREEQHYCHHCEYRQVRYAPSLPLHENLRHQKWHRSLLPGNDPGNDQLDFISGNMF